MSNYRYIKSAITFILWLTNLMAFAQNGPTMGWSSWNTYGVNINEGLIKRQADAMVSKGLKDVGFDHITLTMASLAEETLRRANCSSIPRVSPMV